MNPTSAYGVRGLSRREAVRPFREDGKRGRGENDPARMQLLYALT